MRRALSLPPLDEIAALGAYTHLEMLVAIVIDPSSRLSNGLFYWSEGALNKIESLTTEKQDDEAGVRYVYFVSELDA